MSIFMPPYFDYWDFKNLIKQPIFSVMEKRKLNFSDLAKLMNIPRRKLYAELDKVYCDTFFIFECYKALGISIEFRFGPLCPKVEIPLGLPPTNYEYDPMKHFNQDMKCL